MLVCNSSLTFILFLPLAATPEQMQALGAMLGKFATYAPDFKGPSPPDVAVKAMRSVITNASIEKGHGGTVLSHKGDKQYL